MPDVLSRAAPDAPRRSESYARRRSRDRAMRAQV